MPNWISYPPKKAQLGQTGQNLQWNNNTGWGNSWRGVDWKVPKATLTSHTHTSSWQQPHSYNLTGRLDDSNTTSSYPEEVHKLQCTLSKNKSQIRSQAISRAICQEIYLSPVPDNTFLAKLQTSNWLSQKLTCHLPLQTLAIHLQTVCFPWTSKTTNTFVQILCHAVFLFTANFKFYGG